MGLHAHLKKVLVIGSGPIVIGQAAEFDYSGTQAVKSLIEEPNPNWSVALKYIWTISEEGEYKTLSRDATVILKADKGKDTSNTVVCPVAPT